MKFPIFEPSSAETALGILNGVKEGVSPSDKRLGSQGNWGPWGPSPREKLGTSRLGQIGMIWFREQQSLGPPVETDIGTMFFCLYRWGIR